MNYSGIIKDDIANGSGIRTSLFVSGCRNNCPGCFNKEAQDFNHGEEFTEETINKIVSFIKDHDYVAGLTFLGGEPMEEENQVGILPLILKLKKECPTKTIWLYTGYYLEQFQESGKKFVKDITKQILDNVDVIVDGPFIEKLKNISLQFRGSENQHILYKGKDF